MIREHISFLTKNTSYDITCLYQPIWLSLPPIICFIEKRYFIADILNRIWAQTKSFRKQKIKKNFRFSKSHIKQNPVDWKRSTLSGEVIKDQFTFCVNYEGPVFKSTARLKSYLMIKPIKTMSNYMLLVFVNATCWCPSFNVQRRWWRFRFTRQQPSNAPKMDISNDDIFTC